MTTDIAKRFNDLPWHDSKMLELTLRRTGGRETLTLLVAFLKGNTCSLTTVTFAESAYVDVRIDIDAMRECGDAISGADCTISSPWFDELKRLQGESFVGYLHFGIALIPTGGAIEIVAHDFQLEPREADVSVEQLLAKFY